jgi:threonine dehydrogenase-like Zn-dependent dehydrogenase
MVFVPFLLTVYCRGIGTGSTRDQQDLCDFLAKHKVDLKPIVDKKVFAFEDARSAFDYLESAKHTGNIVIKL